MRDLSCHRRKHAIVVGGSMTGLLAARVFADYFEQVTIVERDRFPAIGEPRRGVPQGRHTHGLLASGRRIRRSGEKSLGEIAKSRGERFSQFHRLHHDRFAALAFLRVANLVAPPPSVMHPRIAMRVLKGSLFG
jgi:2-polyprenyl-6-methoxyphenol hydroxylase-like FAD-dependent oxidoreductase